MEACFGGSRNTAGFRQCIRTGLLPPPTHLTYEGLFSELKFNVGKRTDKVLDLQYGYSRFQFGNSKFDSNINDYLALFVKGKADGQDREDDVRLNLVICLDVSGSMGGGLGTTNNSNQKHKNRLQLSIEAVKMLISKLKPNDSIGMVTFNNSGYVVFECTYKKNIDSEIFDKMDKISCGGGTTIIDGFNKSNDLLKKWIQAHPGDICENRVVMLTDVCDEGLSQQRAVVADAAAHKIHTSIIGISTNFQSQACEVFKDIKGFNYFCAVHQEDIQKYVFDTFDFGFFPSAGNVCLELESKDVAGVEVFGTPDSYKVKGYNKNVQNSNWTISKIESCFPSEIQIHGDTIFTYGGLILIKLNRVSKGPSFDGTIHLSYEDPQGEKYSQNYQLHFQFHPEQQFFSGDELREAIEGFVFTSELKKILEDSSNLEGKDIYDKYWPMLQNLESLCPKKKKEEFEGIKDIVQAHRNEKVKLESAKQ